MDFISLQQVGVLYRIGFGGRSDFEAQMEYWDEIANGPTARLARWIWRGLKAAAAWRPAVRVARLARI